MTVPPYPRGDEPARCRNGRCVRMSPGLCQPCADRLERWLGELPGFVHAVAEPLDMPCCAAHAAPPPPRGARGALDRKAGAPYDSSHPNPLPTGDVRPAVAGVRVAGTRDRPLPGGADRLSWLGPANPGERLDFRGDPEAPGLQTGATPLTATLTGWVRVAAEDLGVNLPPLTVADLLAFLTRWHPELVKLSWSDDYAVEVHGQWATARRMAGEAERWVPIGRCFAEVDGRPCGEPLSARAEAKVIRCPACGADWGRELWLLLGRAMEVGA